MAVQQTASKRSTITAATALCLLGAWHATPVLAASDRGILCENSHNATLEVAEYELIPRQVSHDVDASDMADLASSEDNVLAQDHLLKPRVEATVRKVFADSDKESVGEKEIDSDIEEPAIQQLSAPRMTDGHAAPFKRQMYRKDI